MKMTSLKFSPSRGFIYLLLLACLTGILTAESLPSGDPSKKRCTLRFDCEYVESATIRDISLGRSGFEEMTCTNSTLLLPEGNYEIGEVNFRGGLAVCYKRKTVYLTPEKETVITFAKPQNNSLEIKKQGGSYLIDYNPKAYQDEEFYYNHTHPPTVQIHKNGHLIHSETFEYG